MNHDDPKADVPLPSTLRFVFLMGIAIVIGWFGLFLLLKDRW